MSKLSRTPQPKRWSFRGGTVNRFTLCFATCSAKPFSSFKRSSLGTPLFFLKLVEAWFMLNLPEMAGQRVGP